MVQRDRDGVLEWLIANTTPEPNTGCWLWTKGTRNGYGVHLCASGEAKPAHRLAYEIATGPIAEGMVIDHLCGEKLCVNPRHLEQVTRAENTRRGQPQRGVGRGRHRALTTNKAGERTERILISFSDEEHAAVKAAAALDDRSVSAWLRRVLLREARKP